MIWPAWLADNWFLGLQTVAIVASLIYPQITLRRDDRSRRIGNQFQLTAHYRELWAQTYTFPNLRRIRSANLDLVREPVTDDEVLFVNQLVQHLASAHYAIKNGGLDAPQGLGRDIQTFFANPIPRAVWKDIRHFQDDDFVSFVESHMTTV
jgi:hypothetical protein